MSKETALVIGDLHLFAKPARGEAVWNALPEMLAEPGTARCIMIGDIFDFAWATGYAPGEAQVEAVSRLRTLASAHPAIAFDYVLGNHDYEDQFLSKLEAFSSTRENFEVHPAHLQVGETLFLHGDVADTSGLDANTVLVHRTPWRHAPVHGKVRELFYSLAVSLRLDQLWRSFLFPPALTYRRIRKYLKRNHLAGVTHIVFGHTHRKLEMKPYKNLHLTNPGAPIGKRAFEPLFIRV